LKKSRTYEKYERKSNRFGGLKAPRNPVSVGEEYIVTIEEMGNKGVGVAKFRGLAILVKNTSPGDKVMIRITKITPSSATADVIRPNVTKVKSSLDKESCE
jgi:predicted RNA-binding protein with TRAM domain